MSSHKGDHVTQEVERKESMARSLTLQEWPLDNPSPEEKYDISSFLEGGPCPDLYRSVYAKCREQLGLPPVAQG